MTDWSKGLVKLGLSDQDWGPTVFDSYADLKKNWRGAKDCPTEDALNTAISEVEADEAKVKYKSDRATEYPAIREQLDLLYKDMLADKGDKTGDWFKAVKKVKTDNPKP